MGWSTSWNLPSLDKADTIKIEHVDGVWPTLTKDEAKSDIDFGGVLLKKYDNNRPTHDPYKNPDAHIYYECACGAILDPGTKSFAQLNNHASKEGWKIRFGETGYTPYCVKCGKDIE